MSYRRNPEETLRKWREIISQWQASGETRKKFCEKNDIKYDLFLYYCSRCNLKSEAMTLTPVNVTTYDSDYQIIFPSGIIIKASRLNSLENIISALQAHI